MNKITSSELKKKSDLELIEIAHLNNTVNQRDLIIKAREQLEKKNIIRIDNKDFIPPNWTKESKQYLTEELIRLNKNNNEKYDVYELLKFIIIYPYLIRYNYSNYMSLIELWNQRYYQKFNQRILTLILSITFYYFLTVGFGSYIINNNNKLRQKEIDKIDITDWEKEFGYD